ncbi:MAG: UDP-N-acetylglucosamine 1-carboxyvinyltransferase, partial [Bacilli bacterium]
TDLRAGAALILSGLVSDGVTEVTGLHHLDRGYVDIVSKFRALGAKIDRIKADVEVSAVEEVERLKTPKNVIVQAQFA